jgi:hypothetical protein
MVIALSFHNADTILGPHDLIVGLEVRLEDPFVRARPLE